MKNINQQEWQERIASDKNAVIIDVRTPAECAEGIIENAIMIDFFNAPAFMAAIKEFSSDNNFYVYCRSGNRSSQAASLIEQQGIHNVFNLLGGMMAWNGNTIVPVI